MKKTDKKTHVKSLKFAFLFCVIVFIVVLVASIVHIAILFFHKQFDNFHRFTLLITKDSSYTEIFSFVPDKKTITILHITSDSRHTNIGKELEIPIDARVIDTQIHESDSVSETMWHIVKNFDAIHPWGFNIIDAIFLLIYSKNVHTDSIERVNIHIPYSFQANTRGDIARLFIDNTLFSEGMTITVVNASGISGQGSRMAKMLENIGCDVIAVTTADSPQMDSTLAFSKKESYTVSKLEKILHFQTAQLPQNALSDIIITIGIKGGQTSLY